MDMGRKAGVRESRLCAGEGDPVPDREGGGLERVVRELGDGPEGAEKEGAGARF